MGAREGGSASGFLRLLNTECLVELLILVTESPLAWQMCPTGAPRFDLPGETPLKRYASSSDTGGSGHEPGAAFLLKCGSCLNIGHRAGMRSIGREGYA